MSEDRNKPGVAFWAIVVLLAVLVAYPLSFGPACWMIDKRIIPLSTYRVYRPVLHAAMSSDVIQWYYNCWGASRQRIIIQDAALDYIP